MKTLTIGELANQSGTNRVTIRYYEKMGLLPETQRTESGYRYFPESHIQRLHFIKKAKSLGFTLKEIRELLELHDREHRSSKPIRQAVIKKLNIVTKKIDDLQKLQSSLQKLIATCDGDMPVQQCPIMQNIFSKKD